MKLMTKAGVSEMTGYHAEHCTRLARQGKFPQPIKLGDGKGSAVRWIEAEVIAWIEQRAAARQRYVA